MSHRKRDSLVSGGVSGLIGRAVVQPLDVVKIRLQLQVEPIKANQGKYSSIIQALKCIFKEEGIKGLWKGHMTGQIHAISFSVVQFGLYNLFKKKEGIAGGNDFENLFLGSLSGMGAISITHPLDVLRTRFVAQGEPRIYHSFFHAARTIVVREGYLALFKGWLPNCILISPQTGLQFFFYGLYSKIIHYMIPSNEDINKRGFIKTVFCGGLAGMTAKTSVYPLDLVKKRMQVQGFEEAREKFGKVHKSKGVMQCLKTIVAQEGVKGMIKGLSPSLIKSFLSIGLKFSVYEFVLRILQSQ